MDRRTFLSRVTIALSGAIAGLVGVPIVGYLIAPLFEREPDAYVPVGDASRFGAGTTTLVQFDDPSPLAWAGQTAKTALWVRGVSATSFQVFNVNCTHLGCPVDWRAGANLFLCPCHGGVYYEDGTVAGGPPPRRLFEREWRVSGGVLFVKTQRLPTPGGSSP
ncbi:MAG: menaquinol-cytochrome c reductase iron-sulfur subunit [Chloroflexota bacterium]|jgi:menaquinol-cytochrome c reductase iron-sulfur subunit|nr:menaquinol-cytochrome c reductase iron-sulfur subunit [Chloroflexota bacterium]